MFRKLVLSAGLVSAVALGLGGVATEAKAQEVTLRVHHFLPAQGTVPAEFIVPWAEKVMEESNGRIAVEVYPAMSLGGAPGALIDQAREGVVDIVWVLPGWSPGRFPRSEVFDLPFIAADAESSSRAAWRFYEAHLAEELADVHMIAVNVHGPGMFHMRAPAITTPEDVAGRTVRGPTRMITRLIETMGGTAVGMPVSAVPESLQRNVIEGTVIPWEVTRALRVPEMVDTHTEFGGERSLYTTFFVFAMNHDSYDALPDDLRAVIDANSGIEASGWIGRVMEAGDAPARAVAVERGNTIVTVEGDALEAWRVAAMPVREIWINEMTERGIDGAGLIADFERLLEEELAR